MRIVRWIPRCNQSDMGNIVLLPASFEMIERGTDMQISPYQEKKDAGFALTLAGFFVLGLIIGAAS